MVERTEIKHAQRLGVLPRHFGRQMMRVETIIYYFANRLCQHYTGGFWKYYELDNGGFYMAPDTKEDMHVQWPENGYDGRMSSDAFGITVCLFAFSHLSFIFKDPAAVTDHYHYLRHYAEEHPEVGEIFAAID